MSHSALFLDRDGVINIDHAYVSQIERFEFVDGIFDLCRYAKQKGFLIIVVTNQAGIGRGYYSEDDFRSLTDWMYGEFIKEGAAIDKVYYCPSHPEHGMGKYKVESIFRKPGPGMILQAAEELDVNLERAVLVGDKESDIIAGLAAKVRYNLLYCPQEPLLPPVTSAYAVVKNLEQVIPFLGKV